MGSSLSSRGLQPRPKEPGTLVLALTRFIEKGTMHLDVNQVRAYASLPPAAQLTFSPPPITTLIQEDHLAFDMLRMRLVDIGATAPNAIPVFDLALFISMAAEASELLRANLRYRELEGPGKELAREAFVTALLRAHYRFARSRSGFSLLVTFSVLARVEFLLAMEDPNTGELFKMHFARRACVRRERPVDKNANERRLREASESHLLSLRKGEYAYSKGAALRLQPTVAGVCDNFELWLKYARTARSSFELPPRGMGDNLTAAVTILMLFDAR